ncbi:hypothetical protein ACOMHN_039050 [Nucella lapillus]
MASPEGPIGGWEGAHPPGAYGSLSTPLAVSPFYWETRPQRGAQVLLEGPLTAPSRTDPLNGGPCGGKGDPPISIGFSMAPKGETGISRNASVVAVVRGEGSEE